MSRLIDADSMKADLLTVDPQYEGMIQWCITVLDAQPTIEPRCETCEAFNKTRLLIPQPERKKGKWVSHNEKSREYIGRVLINVEYDYWFCDACGYRVENGQPIYNYCPNCGARMER